jgi:hypothetical protein
MNNANIGGEYQKQRLALGLALGLASSIYLQGCATIQSTAEEDPMMFCGMGSMVTGGAAWAGCHYLLNGSTTSCVIGAVAAAVADGLNCWWLLKQKIVEDYDDTRKKLHYSPSQGNLVKIINFNATPKIVRPGDQVSISAQFALMSPNPMDEIKFERKLTLPGDNKPRTEIITYQPGTWGIEDYAFKIDSSAPEGKVELTLEIMLADHSQADRQTLCFNVVNSGGQPNPADLCPTIPAPNAAIPETAKSLVASLLNGPITHSPGYPSPESQRLDQPWQFGNVMQRNIGVTAQTLSLAGTQE